MKRGFIFLFLFVIIQICTAQNLIQNGNFEDGTSGWYLIEEDEGAEALLSNSEVFQGNSSLKLEISNQETDVVAGVLQSIVIEPNTTYYYSHSIKTEALNYIVYPYMKLNDGTDIFVQNGYFSGYTNDWISYDMRFTTPASVNSLDFFIFLVGNNGTAWVDSIVLTQTENSTDLSFSVDLDSSTEPFNNLLLSTNSSPIRPNSANDLSDAFNDIGITEVRTHDIYDACDINVIFPDFNADPFDPDSYDFSVTDDVVQSIVSVGAKPFFRLGYSFQLDPLYSAPPEDFDKWASICAQIVRHYNEGWNNGFYFDIEKWEIWNEPDLEHFWSGSPQQFFDLYQQTALKLKNVNPNLKVGAAGFANIYNADFILPFLDSLSANNTPIDFISYHAYNYINPYYYTLQFNDLVRLLTNYNLETTAIYLTEWNNYPYNEENTIIEYARDDALSASLTASSFYYLQNSNLSGAYRYRTDEYFFGLFRDNGELSYSGLAFKAISRLKNNDVLQTMGSDTLGNVCIAGEATDGSVNIIISNPNKPSNSYALEIQNLTQSYDYQISRINSEHELVEFETGTVSPGNNTIISNATPPFVDLIRLTVTTNTKENFTDQDVFIFPNPANETLKLQTDREFKTAEISIYSLSGEKMMTVKNTLHVDISQFSNGIYSVVVKLDEFVTQLMLTKIE